MLFGLFSKKRNRVLMGGIFQANAGNAVTVPKGDGIAARSATGVFTVNIGKGLTCESLVAHASAGTGDQLVGAVSYSTSTGLVTITVVDLSGAATADITGLISWQGMFSNRAP
jgi:hypothetical protein